MSMDHIIRVEGRGLQFLQDIGRGIETGHVSHVRVCIDGGQVKFKANQWTWTPGLGELDPASTPAPDSSMVRLKDPRLCSNGWHRTAPVRLVSTCPECPDAEIPPDSEAYLLGMGEGRRDRRRSTGSA